MKITRLSENQRFVFRWWTARELSDYDGIICDGAVRSGKTFCLSASFMTWAMTNFDECIFGLCSKTIVSLKRNILPALRGYMKAMGMTAVEVASKNYMDVSFCGRKNRFYYFGGRDERYHRIYTGTFYERFVLGKWTAAEGLVYPMFDEEKNVFEGDIQCERYVISCDYGTVNPSSFGLWGESGGVWYRLREYYYDSRREGMQKTDEEHYKGLEELADGLCIEKVICDPSAASFIQCIRRHGKFTVQPAKNDVVSGIRLVSDCIKDGRIRINRRCRDTLREINLYRWDEKAGKDAPVKENDHAMDDMRYFAAECLGREKDDFFVLTVEH